MQYDKTYFDNAISRLNTGSKKWDKYRGTDILPFWVADMDFPTPDFVLDAIKKRLEHPIMGYSDYEPSLNASLCDWLSKKHNWAIDQEWITWTPGVVPGLNLAALTLSGKGSILIPTPVYPPFLEIARNAKLDCVKTAMQESDLQYSFDFDQMEKDITPDTRMLFICNPQNPTGRSFDQDELGALANFIERHDLVLVSDEIHCSILLDNNKSHLPIARDYPEITSRTISLFSVAKTYNIPGMRCAASIIPNKKLREQFRTVMRGVVPNVGPLESLASIAAFSDESDWTTQLNSYLSKNSLILKESMGDRMRLPEATYLAWIRIDDLKIKQIEKYFDQYGLGISPGNQFGDQHFVRFNFACPEKQLYAGIERLELAIDQAPRAR